MSSFTRQMHNMFKLDDRHQWLRDADLTYCAARHLILSEDVFFRPAGGYLLHLAVEKYFKTIRKVLRPQIDVKRGRHDLRSLHSSLIKKARALNRPEILESIDKLVHLHDWRYVDGPSDKSPQSMKDGLTGADFLVATGRGEIPDEILFQGLYRILQLPGAHRQRLVEALFKNNAQHDYWKTSLLGIDQELDAIIERFTDNSSITASRRDQKGL